MAFDSFSRRSVLKGVGAGAITTFAVGPASGESQAPERHNIGTGSPAAKRAASQAADSVHRILEWDGEDATVSGRFPEAALEQLRARSDVRYVEADGTMHAIAQTLPWGVDRVDADVLHSDGETGDGADVAIIDTGIDDDHPDLEANVGAGKAFVDCRGGNCNYPWSDDNDHGTHCAGIADAVDNTEGVVGVSTQATLHAVKVLDGNGSGSFSDVAAGIEYVADQGWDVGSLSLGASSGSETVKDACRYATDNGVLLVAAAGNDGPCTDCVGYPAAYDTVMAVSSTDSDDSLSSFSSTGPEVELAAPGGSIYSTVIDGYDTFSGTSMACPHVSGAGGQLMANGYTNTEARDQLNSTAEDIGLSDNEQGNGLLDAEAAVLDGSTSSLSVSTGDATSVGTDSATLNGSLDDLGGADSADVYFEYRESGAETWNATSVQTRSSTGSFSEDITGLSSDMDYEFRAVAEASDGDTDTGSTNTFTTDSDSTNTAPTVTDISVTENSNPAWNRYEVAWSVSDDDGNLDTVEVELLDNGGDVLDSATTSVSGSSASGSDEVRSKQAADHVTVTVTDTAGASDSASQSV